MTRKKTTAPVRKAPVRRKRRRVNKLRLWTLILMVLVVCELICVCAGLIMYGKWTKDKPTLEVDDFFSQESSHIYDRSGNLIADVGTQLRENVTYNELSEALIDSFLAVEDSRFFAHDGFDMPRFIKAVLENVKAIIMHDSSRQGGSTFTMQLVKLTYFQNDEAGTSRTKDFEYKVQQIVLARELEEKSNKKAVFEMYLNKMNFGGTGNIRGIEKASQYYYGKHAGELNLAESAMLAGVINSPYYYDPHNFLDYATERRNTVLYQMMHHGYITEKEYRLAVNIKVEDTLIDPATGTGGRAGFANQSYIDTVISEAEALTGQDPFSVAMEIYTYMDPAAQKVMDDIQAGNNPNVVFPDELIEIGVIAENNQTGEIVAIGGGRNYGRGGSMLLNHATNQYKQPGSTVKPIIDYALAFEYLGWSTSHVVTDRPIIYEGTDVIIKNANGQYGGQMPLRYAVSMSLNTPAIQTLQSVIDQIGWQAVVDYIRNLGFSQVSEETFDIGFAIGGSNFTCTPLELMAAHAVLMNGGNYIRPHTISRIVFRNGMQDPVEPHYDAVPVLSPQASYLAATLMNYVVSDYIYAQPLRREYPVYVKTGTTDWGSEGLEYNIPAGVSKDVWMVAETGQYTSAVWVGYEKGIKDKDTWLDDYKLNMNIQGMISNEVLSVLNDSLYPAGVQRPEGISDITHIIGTYPYAYPIEDMDPQYITSGMIKSEYAELAAPESAEDIKDLTEFTAEYSEENGNVQLHWAAYPDEDKLKVAEDTMDISLYAGETMLQEAWGRRIFDYSWIFGPIRYKAEIRQNGEVKAEAVSEEVDFTQDVALDPDTDTEACGFYAYENNDTRSNEVCVTFHTPKDEEEKPDDENPENPEKSPAAETYSVPNTDADVGYLQAWCSENSIEMQEGIDRAEVGLPDVAETDTNVIFIAAGQENELQRVNGRTDIPKNVKLICYIYKQ